MPRAEGTARLALLPAVARMDVHIAQAMGYDWMLRDLADTAEGARLLDFGSGGYPLIVELAGMGAAAFWMDRDDAVAQKMQALATRTKTILTRYMEPMGGTFDIIVASNAVQHNHEVGPVYDLLRRLLAPSGRLYVVEAVTDREAYWDGARVDPCWYRPATMLREQWQAAGLRSEREAFFRYRFARDAADETAAWCGEPGANRVVARLRVMETPNDLAR